MFLLKIPQWLPATSSIRSGPSAKAFKTTRNWQFKILNSKLPILPKILFLKFFQRKKLIFDTRMQKFRVWHKIIENFDSSSEDPINRISYKLIIYRSKYFFRNLLKFLEYEWIWYSAEPKLLLFEKRIALFRKQAFIFRYQNGQIYFCLF